MMNLHSLENEAHASTRRVALALSVLGALAFTACGSSASPSSSSSAPAATPTPLTTATPGPASLQGTLTGDARVTGPLTIGSVHFVRCEEPTLNGPTIYAFESTADPSVGTFLTIRGGSIDVRLGSGSGATYTERDFHGTGVTSFGAASGAQFSASLSETTAAGQNKGTVEAVSSISGSVSCGTFTPGGGTITVVGDTGHGMISGALTSIRVTCSTSAQVQSAVVSGLTHVGSAPAVVELSGGVGGSPFFVAVNTASGGQQNFRSASTGLVTFSAGGVTYTATPTELTASGPGTHTVMVSGSATCGT